MASATAGSAECCNRENWASISLISSYRFQSDLRLLARFDDKHRRPVGLRRHDAHRDDRRLVGEADAEGADQLGQCQCRLDQREMRADADPGTCAEGQVSKTI